MSQPATNYRQVLTSRQIDVADLVAVGMSNPEIAEILRVDARYVGNVIHQILIRFAVRNRTEIALVVHGKMISDRVNPLLARFTA